MVSLIRNNRHRLKAKETNQLSFMICKIMKLQSLKRSLGRVMPTESWYQNVGSARALKSLLFWMPEKHPRVGGKRCQH